MKYKIGTYLINQDREVVVVKDTDVDRHTYKRDYQLRVISGGLHTVGSLFWMPSSLVDTWFREMTPQEVVLYGTR